ncbi:MAG: carbohydrate kinase [Phycisphaerae bacterium]
MYNVAGIGEVLYDVYPEGKRLGGAPSNFVFHAVALGLDGVVVSACGRDELGAELKADLAEKGMSLRGITENDHPTGAVLVSLDSAGVAHYRISEGAAWDYITCDETVMKLAEGMDAVCFGSLAQRAEISRNSIRRFLKATRPDCLRVFDVNLRLPYYSREIIEQSLELANVLKLNEDEIIVLKDMFGLSGSEDRQLSELQKRFNLRTIALTKGPKGSTMLGDSESHSFAGFPADVIDTVGAGDSFTAAMVFGLLNGYSLEKTNILASRVASFVCSRHGATPSPEESSCIYTELGAL